MKRLNRKGFSLVELMGVVAIIGILSAIAIPNFQRFQRKSRQSEAKTMLDGIYSAEKAFHTEWNVYYTDLDVVGYVPNGQMRYNGGFSASTGAAGLPAGYAGPLTSGRFTAQQVCAATANQCGIVTALAALTMATVNPAVGNVGNAALFTAGAETADTAINAVAATHDEWSINQGGNILNVQSGI